MSFTSLLTVAAEHGEEPAINPYLVGAIALVILLAMLLGLTTFAKGRDHS
ncbi:MAG TPA: hypothetical protein VFO98_10185 [Marmoricola sp.]|nr:hypothetical protein [Marmoricola sp.]